jgi:hypothetical protein
MVSTDAALMLSGGAIPSFSRNAEALFLSVLKRKTFP